MNVVPVSVLFTPDKVSGMTWTLKPTERKTTADEQQQSRSNGSRSTETESPEKKTERICVKTNEFGTGRWRRWSRRPSREWGRLCSRRRRTLRAWPTALACGSSWTSRCSRWGRALSGRPWRDQRSRAVTIQISLGDRTRKLATETRTGVSDGNEWVATTRTGGTLDG